jgi:hypothetical protein
MNIRRLLLLLSVILMSSQAVYAQGRSSLFSAPITVSSGVEDVLGPDGGIIQESTLVIQPISPELIKSTPRSLFRLSYTPEIQFIRDGSHKATFWNHTADLGYAREVGRRTLVTVGHSFIGSSDPARVFSDNLFSLPRNTFRENATAVTANHSFTRKTSLGLRFDNTFTRISAPDVLEGAFINQYGVAGTASLSRNLTEHSKLIGSYSMLKFRPYEFLTPDDATGFLGALPTVRAGFSRYAYTLALSVSASTDAPNSILRSSPDDSSSSGRVTAGLPSSPPAGNSGAGPLVGFAMPGAADPTASGSSSGQVGRGDTRLLGDPFHTAVLTYRYAGPKGLVFAISGGVMADNDVSPLMGVLVEKRYESFWASVGLQQFRSHYGPIPVQGIPPSATFQPEVGRSSQSVFSSGTFIIGGKLTRRTELEFSVGVSDSTANFAEHHVRVLVGQGRVSHWLTERFGLFATADTFNEDRRETGARSFDRQRYFAGIQIRVSPPPRRPRAGPAN